MDENFKKKIVDDFGLTALDSAEQEKYIERIGNMLFESVVERSVDLMDEAAMTDFENTVNAAGTDYQKVIGFLQTRVPGFSTIVSDEMSRLKRATAGMFA